jgi:peroxiredoxin Q/BCP
LRHEFKKLEDAGIVVLGINSESQRYHLEFKNRLKVPFPLLTAGSSLLKSFEVNGWFGEIKRKTFLIDEHGVLVKIIEDVKLRKHHLQILNGFGL